MAASKENTGFSVDAELTSEVEAMLADPSILFLAALGLSAYLIGRFVIGPRDPNKPRKWWDYRRID